MKKLIYLNSVGTVFETVSGNTYPQRKDGWPDWNSPFYYTELTEEWTSGLSEADSIKFKDSIVEHEIIKDGNRLAKIEFYEFKDYDENDYPIEDLAEALTVIVWADLDMDTKLTIRSLHNFFINKLKQ